MGSMRGSVSVWAVGDHLYGQMQSVIQQMSSDADFWYNYPIFLPDYHPGFIDDQTYTHLPTRVPGMPIKSDLEIRHHPMYEEIDANKQRANVAREPDNVYVQPVFID